MLAPLINSLAIGAPDINGPLVQEDNGDIHVNPIMTKTLVEELHHLNKRSYRITNRGVNEYDYLYPKKLTTNRVNRFSITNISDDEVQQESNWFIHKPFTGTQGANELNGLLGKLPLPFKTEMDYSGFVALSQAQYDLSGNLKRPPIIAVVFRGSQSKSFQAWGGVFGPSWLTNFSASKMITPKPLAMEGAVFHKGFLEKYMSARLNIHADIREMWNKIPEDLRENTRFIITGHSQGAGIAIPAALDIVKSLGKEFFGGNFDNTITPRFFVYALSGPNPTGDDNTKAVINQVVGRDNIIRHSSIFDIVTYVCLGKTYDKWFYNLFFYYVAGVEAGYHPVGHLAIDDTRRLFLKGLEYNEQLHLINSVDEIDALLKQTYSEAIRKRQSSWYVSCFHKTLEAWYLARSLNRIEGIKNFVFINHYGSTTANVNCLPRERLRSLQNLTSDERTENDLIDLRERIAALADDTNNEELRRLLEQEEQKSHSASFDPRLPETDLTRCLERGKAHRALVKNISAYEGSDQVFPRVPFQETHVLDAYDSEDEVD